MYASEFKARMTTASQANLSPLVSNHCATFLLVSTLVSPRTSAEKLFSHQINIYNHSLGRVKRTILATMRRPALGELHQKVIHREGCWLLYAGEWLYLSAVTLLKCEVEIRTTRLKCISTDGHLWEEKKTDPFTQVTETLAQ
ncbi:hypothetical protein T265_11272 [Opisthorchis viverrini]|uniref:Uncharacterized protein n=1 Tax=Opisthorchis viverrini TaxID=6198 RepID=A0A074ZA35_OPIVI|nr:hypothetical protein T265_11272 [Opisthorchis viverrini]KER20100.1 hypothetical protein T265_11272 [Opisthorchis viverrini]